MRNPNAMRCSTLTSSLCVLGLLTACANERVVTKTEYVEVPVPVVEKIEESLTKDCEPKYRYPVESMKVRHLKDRAEAAEDALAICRNQLELIRSGQGESIR